MNYKNTGLCVIISFITIHLVSACMSQPLASTDNSNTDEPSSAITNDPDQISNNSLQIQPGGQDDQENPVIQHNTPYPSNNNNHQEKINVTMTPDNRLPPERWREWPVVPEISQNAIQIYRRGIGKGNNPRAFSKVGDCQSISEVLLGIYDKPDRYILREKENYLRETIENFAGSFNRDGMAVKGGFNAASVLSPLWADPEKCQAGETPVECETRVHNPSIEIISLEVWWKGRTTERYEENMRQIIEYALAHGVVPILSTKADNVEKDHSINLATARLAYEYDIPLWNFWLAVQSLPNQGIDPARDGFHITTEAWNVRSFTALQVLDAVWRAGQGKQGQTQELISTPAPEITNTPDPKQSLFANEAPSVIGEVKEDMSLIGATGSIIYNLKQKAGNEIEDAGIFTLNLDEQIVTKIISNGYSLQTVAPGGQLLLVNHGADLYIVRPQDQQVLRISDSFYQYGKIGANFSVDGSHILLISNNAGSMGLWKVKSDGSDWQRMIDPESNVIELYPSSNLNAIFWGSGNCGGTASCQRQGTWVKYMDTNQIIEMKDVKMPVIRPDGSMIAYTFEKTDGKSDIKIRTLDGKIDRLIELPGDYLADYAWSPDGTKFAVLKLMRSNYYGKATAVRVFVITPENWVIQEYEPSSGLNALVRWSPDGKKLVITSSQGLKTGGFRVGFCFYNLEQKRVLDIGDYLIRPESTFFSISNMIWSD